MKKLTSKEHNLLLKECKYLIDHSKINGKLRELCFLPSPKKDVLYSEQDLFDYQYRDGGFAEFRDELLSDESKTALSCYCELCCYSEHESTLKKIAHEIFGLHGDKAIYNQKITEAIIIMIIKQRYHLYNGKLFEISNLLFKSMLDTDIKGKCPVHYFTTPFRTIYMHYGFNNEYKYRLESSELFLDGAYISQVEISDREKQTLKELFSDKFFHAGILIENITRIIDIVAVLASPRMEDITDMKSRQFSLYIDNESLNIEEIFEKNLKAWTFQENELDAMETKDTLTIVSILAKTLLYINTKESNFEFIDIESPLKRKLNSSINAVEKRKIQKQLYSSYNKIVIKHHDLSCHEDISIEKTLIKKGVIPHWRRGHFRILSSSLKMIWIKPTLVNACLVKKENTTTKTYEVV